MTATPRILSARAKRSALDADVEFASMDDEDTFGPVFHRLTFATAIERELLADYQVVILGVDNEEILKAIQERQFVTTNGKNIISADRLGAAVGLAKAIRKYGLTRLITFHGRVKAASNFADTFPAILDWMPARQRPKGVTETNFVSGEMSAGERKRALRHLKTSEADQVILANARVLTEGIDVPDLDGVAFMDPRNSEVDIVQAVGRAIRKPRDKNKDKIGTIVLPIVIEQTEDAEEELDRSDYRAIWAVLRALRAHDERLAEEIDALRRSLGRTGRIRRSDVSDSIMLDLPRRAGASFAQALATQLIASSSSPWEEGFGQLERFVSETGHARPPTDYVAPSGFTLGRWVSKARSRRNRLSIAQQNSLSELPGWAWHRHETVWMDYFADLVEFSEVYGHARPEKSQQSAGGRDLGEWVSRQRGRRVRESMPEARRKLLEALPGWTWDARDAAWERGYSALRDYVGTFGTSAVPQKYRTSDGYALGFWVMNQRRNTEGLSHERVVRLQEFPGWTWNTREQDG